MTKNLKLACVTMLCLCCGSALGQSAADKILGVYRVVSEVSKEVVKVKITKNGVAYQIQIIWMEKPLDEKGQIKRDRYNPDPKLRSITGDKIILTRNLKYDSKEDEWTGKLYDPDSGKTYKTVITFDNHDNLNVRGYVGIPAFGRTMVWKKSE